MHAQLMRLAEDAEAPDASPLEASWDALEARLMRHLEAEETYLLPLLEASHPNEVARTLAEHRRIRDIVAAVGISIELHSVRKPELLALVELLNAHAAYEDTQLYPLAADKASVAVEHSVSATLKSLRSVLTAGKSASSRVAGGSNPGRATS